MRSAILILNVFAAAWAWAALGALDASTWAWALPVFISASLVAVCWRTARPDPEPPPDVKRRIGRVVAFWSAVEVLLIVVGVWAMVQFDAEGQIAPLVGLIVGLHFVALARGLPFRAYYATGGALIVVSAIAFFLPGDAPLVTTGFGAALILWATGVAISSPSPRTQGESTESARNRSTLRSD